jgi:hypothetical protein
MKEAPMGDVSSSGRRKHQLSRPLIVFVVVLLLAMLGALWFQLSDSSGRSDRAALSGPAVETPLESGEDVPVQDPPFPDPPTTPSETVEPPRASIAVIETEDGSFALPDDAIWIDGRVLLPEGTPPDEGLHVIASGRRFTSERKAPRKHIAPVEADGRFRVAFGAKTRKGFLTLEGRYLYLEGNQKVELGELEGEVVLGPSLGGVIAVVARLPEGESPDGLRLRAWLYGSSHMGHLALRQRDPGGAHELTALPPGSDYDLDLVSPDFPGEVWEGLVVRAGEVTELLFAPTPVARLTGRIVGVDGEGLEGAEVALHVEGDSEGQDSGVLYEFTTEDGSFESRLMPGKLSIDVRAAGHLEHQQELGRIDAGETREGLLIQLSVGNSIAGRVLWPDGTPAAGALVTAVHGLEEAEVDRWERTFSTKTDEEGHFRISGLDDRPILISAVARREVTVQDEVAEAGETRGERRRRRGPPGKGKLSNVAPGSEDLVVTLLPGATLRGRVTDDTGLPVSRYRVAATPVPANRKDPISRTIRDEDGAFELTGLDDGLWDVEVTAEGMIQMADVDVRLPTDDVLELTVSRTVRITGTVLYPSGVPIAEADVTLDLRGRNGRPEYSDSTTADQDGRFVIAEAPAGALMLSADTGGWWESPMIQVQARPGETHDDLVITMLDGATLTGEVHPAAGPVASREIAVRRRVGFTTTSTRVVSDAEGAFQVTGLPPGRYELELDLPRDVQAPGDWHLRDAMRPKAEVLVPEGGSAHVVIGAPREDEIVVHGQVTAGERAIPGLVVRCHSDGFKTAAACDELGHYELRVPAAGRYGFTLRTPSDDSVSVWRALGEERRQRVDIALPVGSISGTLVASSGQSVASIGVQLKLLDNPDKVHNTIGHKWTDSEGRFRFEFLSPGRYRLCAPAPNMRRSNDARFAPTVINDLVVGLDQPVSGVVIPLGSGGKIEGTVKRPDGSPASEADIYAFDELGYEVLHVRPRIDKNGEFEIQGVPAGVITLRRWTADREYAEAKVMVSVGETSRVDLVVSK